jgi:hypothetical protein
VNKPNFKSKKRPWTSPISPRPSSPSLPSDKSLGGQNLVFPEELEEDAVEDAQKTSLSEEAERGGTPFRYKSRADVLSRSFRGNDSAAARFARRQQIEQNLKSAGSGASTTATSGESNSLSVEGGDGELLSGERAESEKSGGKVGSEGSSVCTSAEGSRTELSTGAGQGEGVAKPHPVKSHPYSRKIDISPIISSPQRARPKILAYGKSDADLKRKSPALLTRRSTFSSASPGRRLLPAPPVRRGSRTAVLANTTTPSGDDRSGSPSNAPMPAPGGTQSVNSFASKLANSLEDHVKKSQDAAKCADGDETSERDALEKPRPHSACPARSESLSSLNEEPPPSPKVKHTVQYKNSALSNKGECYWHICPPFPPPLAQLVGTSEIVFPGLQIVGLNSCYREGEEGGRLGV